MTKKTTRVGTVLNEHMELPSISISGTRQIADYVTETNVIEVKGHSLQEVFEYFSILKNEFHHETKDHNKDFKRTK